MNPALDFETEAIQARPDYPPAPGGLAVANGRDVYYTRQALEHEARRYWDETPIFHSANFDIAVAMEKLGLPFPRDFEDTLYLIALLTPYAKTLSLKPSLEAHLGRKPSEQLDLKAWIKANVPGANEKNWGAFILRAPHTLVSPYARQDARGTVQLFRKLLPQIKRKGMLPAYEREKRLLPMLLDAERRGVRVNVNALKRDVAAYSKILDDTDVMIRHGFKAPNLDVDSNEQLADAIEKMGVELPKTDKGNRKTDKGTLANTKALPKRLQALLLYRSKLASDLRTFMIPWLATAKRTGGTIHTHWNQVRGSSNLNARGGGARTGRMSSEPNFQNITTDEKIAETIAKLNLLWARGDWFLPSIRNYILPYKKGWVLYGRDFNQQELRLFAHFEDGPLLAAYKADPKVDIHEAVRQLIAVTGGVDLPRKLVKICNFLTIYGGGIPALAAQSGLTEPQAATVREHYFKALPSVKEMQREIQRDDYVRTIGGRVYEPESGYEYKLLNYLIQGSAADQTKEAMVQWWEKEASEENVFCLQVHDELVMSCPREIAKERSFALDCIMTSVFSDRIDTPFLTDGEVGASWGAMK